MSSGGMVRKIFPEEHELMAALEEMRREHQPMYAQLLDAGIDPEDLLRFMPLARICTLVRIFYSFDLPEMAKRLGVPAKKLEALERGDLASIDPGILARYVAALELTKLFNAWAARNSGLAARLHSGQLLAKGKRSKSTGSKSKAKRIQSRTLQFKVTLCGVQPTVWRRFLVPEHLSLNEFHLVLQAVMGWDNLHWHEFVIRGVSFLLPGEDAGTDSFDEQQFQLADLKLRRGQTFDYWYDMDDEWHHVVKLERRIEPGYANSKQSPFCIEGEGACPPEESGGPKGYLDMLQALRDPKHPLHKKVQSWAGSFDPGRFDLARVNELIRSKPSREQSP